MPRKKSGSVHVWSKSIVYKGVDKVWLRRMVDYKANIVVSSIGTFAANYPMVDAYGRCGHQCDLKTTGPGAST